MDIRDIKERIVELRNALKKNDIRGDIFILYGSYATGKNRKDSDIDIAVVSRDFGRDRFREGSTLNYIAQKIDVRFEAVPVDLKEYMSRHSISPLLAEIDKNGIVLL
ncbi:MAG TPA: nucleotidyltransferase domain-containing protein [Spirochaetota bacterium]|nr:nucleotidyltransferase domain-containing protein [Spirochaetota bacterium]HPQ54368.1 nucleotidyltransferase domain-containing protein [Spirochaetota bacterium]